MGESVAGEGSGSGNCLGWAARDEAGHLSPYKFNRRPTGPDDVAFKITHCGLCHGELHWVFNKDHHARYPMVPGHEVTGLVTEVGANVSHLKPVDRVGVGCYCNSCRNCESCANHQENYCTKGSVFTYNGKDEDGSITMGGCSTWMVAHQRYVLRIPDKLPLDAAAPLLCVGTSVYSPMMRHGMNQPGKHLGVVSLGGLGHLAVKFGKAFGLKVTVFSTSEGKKDEAINLLGADHFVISSDPQQMQAALNTLDFIIDTCPTVHPLDDYIKLLKLGGVIVIVGVPHELKFSPILLLLGRKTITSSATGGVKEIQEMLEFSAENEVFPLIETVPIQDINTALQRMANKDVRHRFEGKMDAFGVQNYPRNGSLLPHHVIEEE